MLGLRLTNSLAKFALSLYMVRYLGLAEVGVFGLLVSASTGLPAIFGFGLNDWTARHLVGLDRAKAIPIAVARLSLTLATDLVLLAAFWAAILALDLPIERTTALLMSAILVLEHLAMDEYAIEIGRERIVFVSFQHFFRAGVWPIPVIAWGLLDPAARSLDVVLLGWLAGQAAMWLLVGWRALSGGRWRLLGFDRGYLGGALRGSVHFWLADIGLVGNQHLDRFLVSLFLGLETTGIYVLFWSVANVVHTLSVIGILQPQTPRLIAAERTGDPAAFAAERRRVGRDASLWAALLAIGAGIALPLVLPWFGRPQLAEALPIYYVILAATLARIGSDGFGFVLIALHRDRAIAATALGGVAATAAADLALIPAFGLPGAAAAYLVVGLALVALRRWLVTSEVARRASAAS